MNFGSGLPSRRFGASAPEAKFICRALGFELAPCNEQPLSPQNDCGAVALNPFFEIRFGSTKIVANTRMKRNTIT
jgi:hypothetical protein